VTVFTLIIHISDAKLLQQLLSVTGDWSHCVLQKVP